MLMILIFMLAQHLARRGAARVPALRAQEFREQLFGASGDAIVAHAIFFPPRRSAAARSPRTAARSSFSAVPRSPSESACVAAWMIDARRSARALSDSLIDGSGSNLPIM